MDFGYKEIRRTIHQIYLKDGRKEKLQPFVMVVYLGTNNTYSMAPLFTTNKNVKMNKLFLAILTKDNGILQ